MGSDRRHNRYWHLAPDPNIPGDPSTGRILVESHADGSWRLLYKADQIEQLITSLERKGAREGPLHSALVRHQPNIETSMPSHPIQMPLTVAQQSQQQQTRLNTEYYTSLFSIPLQASAHLHGRDPGASIFMHHTAATQLHKLKADMLRVEAALPSEALRDPTWSRMAWQSSVKQAEDVILLQHALAELEMAIHPAFMWMNHHPRHLTAIKRDWLPIGRHTAWAGVPFLHECFVCKVLQQGAPFQAMPEEKCVQSRTFSCPKLPFGELHDVHTGNSLASLVLPHSGQDIHGRLPTPAPQTHLPAGHAEAASAAASLSTEHLGCLPTYAAVSLRLHAIDAAIMYRPGEQSARDVLPVRVPHCTSHKLSVYTSPWSLTLFALTAFTPLQVFVDV